MRKIKFKGKDFNGRWVYGYYHSINDADMGTIHHFIMDDSAIDYAVQQKTVCEYTGLNDFDGKDIYEHDVLNIDGVLFEVVWRESGFRIQRLFDEYYNYAFDKNKARKSFIVNSRY